MAPRRSKRKTGKSKRKPAARRFRPVRFVLRWTLRGALIVFVAMLLSVVLYSQINPPTTHTIWSEKQRLGSIQRSWTPAGDIAPVMLRAVVAAEDANFCTHWGFDMSAIRAAIAAGGARGGSTISQQVVKNVWLWQGRSYLRKAVEAIMTPMMEAVWSKRRVLEVYLNIAEMGEGIFGVNAAARHYFGTSPDKLTARQAALIASALPNPKVRNPARPSALMQRRARTIQDGAATILADGRAACFE